MAAMDIRRRINRQVAEDLTKKMVFISGPRQCGKTTLAEGLLRETPGRYYNWDIAKDRKLILQDNIDLDAKLWVFDELHKFRRWRNFLKGLCDEFRGNHPILVTGSARLDLYGRSGDSLQGRYYHHHLHPFTLSEVCGLPFPGIDAWLSLPVAPPKEASETLEHLLRFSGFPEPFLASSESAAKRWRLLYADRLIQEELRSLEDVREIDRIALLLDRLDDIAGSIVSINSLREDLDVSFDSVRKWLDIFERIFACFRIPPYGPPKLKAVKKERKLYLWDASKPTHEGARLENLIALHLLRLVDWARDIEGEKLDLRYYRHRDGTEVDFVLLRDRRPWVAIEVKLQDQELSRGLRYFLERVPTPFAFQVFLNGTAERTIAKVGSTLVRSVASSRFLCQLP